MVSVSNSYSIKMPIILINRWSAPFKKGREELKYLWVLFTIEAKMEHEMDGWIGTAPAVLWEL